MVAAGVYLVARTYGLFLAHHSSLIWVAYIGAITAFMAATIATVNNDIKRILAYSTISQLGFMMLALGVGGYDGGTFHLMTHAFFKALLFLCAGSVIHAVHTQDIFKMGGLLGKMKATGWTLIIGALAIAGVPPLSGFWSKDEILSEILREGHPVLFGIAAVTSLLTAFYMFRLIFVVLFGKPRSELHAHESPAVMTVPLGILAAFSIFAGFFRPVKFEPLMMGISIAISAAGKKPVSGYLSIPRSAKPRSLPIHVGFKGYSVSGAEITCINNQITFNINAHGIENGKTPAYYKELESGELKGYGFHATENNAPETAYFLGMFLRVMRAIDYVQTLPEWNARDLEVSGGSQGGFQALAAAALRADVVTRCSAYKPWCCDLAGVTKKRISGWRPTYTEALDYFDGVSMAVSGLVGGAGAALDTLKELAAALGNDPSFATTIATQIANRVRFDDAQVLTAPQKAQACDNIGAASLVATGDLDRDFAAAYTAAKV
jgi:hypothetical protein